MIITVKTRKWGASLGIVIPFQIVEAFKIKEEDLVELNLAKINNLELNEIQVIREARSYRCVVCNYISYHDDETSAYCTACDSNKVLEVDSDGDY